MKMLLAALLLIALFLPLMFKERTWDASTQPYTSDSREVVIYRNVFPAEGTFTWSSQDCDGQIVVACFRYSENNLALSRDNDQPVVQPAEPSS